VAFSLPRPFGMHTPVEEMKNFLLIF